MSDEMPSQPKTQQLPAADPVQVMLKQMQAAITASMQAGFRETNANIDLVSGDVKSLKRDVRDLQEWKAKVDKPPSQPPLTSVRVGAIVEERASQMNVEQDAKFAIMLAAKDEEIAKLRAETATKEDIAKALEEAAKAQTEAIVAGVKATVDTLAKTDTWQRIKSVAVPVLLLALGFAGMKLQAAMSRAETQPAPASISADAGAE